MLNIDLQLTALSTTLNEISIAILEKIRSEGMEAVLDIATKNLYRDSFERVTVKQSLLEPWSNRIKTESMSVEIITTIGESTEIHYHKDAYAVLTILGEWEGVKEPTGSVYYFGSATEALPAISKITLQATPGTIHGFKSPEGANSLIFLSVQSTKIDEDFYVVE